ncbi:radical SAM protein [Micromonospora robiginosa]|uniref:Radical SAM protein n=1 Tax=Micromonospora robiginosa TaxID=2749844 RepID=A0A7L6B406_9ACTN|nr:radical SAM protein [Micromonospora ferruginea]QLQ36713.1 radical SAM protein [Micromonospora ferruginea]
MPALANEKIRLIVTAKCNLDCFYCHNEGQAKEETFISPVQVEVIGGALDAASLRASEVTISGGEPLLHPELAEIIGLADAFADHVTMVSNGILARPAQLGILARRGLRKLRLGVDSLDDTKPRPSPGRLAAPFRIQELVASARALGILVDLNTVVTRYNRNQLGDLARFAVTNGLSIKFFEHVEVDEYGTVDNVGEMLPRPQVPVEHFERQLNQALGTTVELVPTPEFGESNVACRIDGIEIRYCRYLCAFDLCWLTGTRIDPRGFVYNCMVNRGLDRLSDPAPSTVLNILSRASARPCKARIRSGS